MRPCRRLLLKIRQLWPGVSLRLRGKSPQWRCYARSTLAEKKAVKAGVAEIYAAVAARDKPAVEAAYARFTKAYVPVNPFGDSVGVDAGQGCATGCDYDWKARTPKGTLFIF